MEEETRWEVVENPHYPVDIKIDDWNVKAIYSMDDFDAAKEKVNAFINLMPEDERIYRQGTSVIILKRK